MKGKRVAGSSNGMNSVDRTHVRTQLPTPPPPGHPPPGVRLPSPASFNGSEQGEIYEDKAELQLLDDAEPGTTESCDHELKTAPLFTRDARLPAGFRPHKSQYGLLGSLMGIRDKSRTEVQVDPRVYVNTNAPFSAIVCGVQGSGKSHTVSVLLENMIIPNCKALGPLEKPLAGLVLHFGTGGENCLPCEAAYLARQKYHDVQVPPVRVYVSRSVLNRMRRVYAPLGKNVIVEPLLFTEDELDAQAFLSMMAVESSDSAPLYMQVFLSILRELGEDYTYEKFLEKLEVQCGEFSKIQRAHLDQRMALLKLFTSTEPNSRPRFIPGQLTIVDLSDPFIDPKSACGLFEIVTRIFTRADLGKAGKVLLVDEAHKYLSASVGLTEALLSLSRQMRHHGMRVIISSQEPTVVPPVLLDLCSVAFMHRFSSRSWWDHVSKHFSADLSSAFDEIVRLRTGQAIVLAPSALAMLRKSGQPDSDPQLFQLGRRYMQVKIRKRVTKDGGASILVV